MNDTTEVYYGNCRIRLDTFCVRENFFMPVSLTGKITLIPTVTPMTHSCIFCWPNPLPFNNCSKKVGAEQFS